MIDVRDLRKEYGGFVAVDGVSFDVDPGEVFGIVGPNGAGKTTTLKSMAGLVEPTDGVVAAGVAAALALAIPVRQRAQLTYSLGALAAFAAAAGLPEHPATTVARLAIGSAAPTTWCHLAGYVVAAVVVAVAVRRYAGTVSPERFG